VVSSVNVRVRISDLLTERRYAVCVRRSGHRAWVLPLDAARKLHRDLGEAIEAVERLSVVTAPAPVLAAEAMPARSARLARESGR
jgi:hypothetical protein